MPRKGRNFELAYKWLYNMDKKKYYVKSPAYVIDKVTGRKREVDVLVKYIDNDGITRRIAIECRDRKNVEDSTWIEQLKTKKEDLELDYIIATTTRDFSKEAIVKARHHGIIIEKAELFNSKVIEETLKEFLIDMFFLKFEMLKITFLLENNVLKSLLDFSKELPFYQYYQLIQELNTGLYFSIEPHNIIDKEDFDRKTFFEKTENSYIIMNNDTTFDKDKCPKIIRDLGIKMVFSQIQMLPFHLSLPLNRSLSIFEVEQKKNKKYSAFFGDDEENIEYGYLDDGKIYCKMNLKDRKYFRFVSSDMKFNTIFPDVEKNMAFDMEEISKKCMGSFDFSKVLEEN